MHRVVDAMNVIGSRPDGWWRDRDGAVERLASQLERWAEASGERVTVVLERRPRVPLPVTLVNVEWAPEPGRDAADREIVRRLAAWLAEGEVTVVTSDRDLATQARAAGAAVDPSSRFRARLEAT
ncbi:MAG: NYN domain-containing protein [Actinobacteria bacterium]|nr:NYN domain-containing protein [Actinomycetota bacterium]